MMQTTQCGVWTHGQHCGERETPARCCSGSVVAATITAHDNWRIIQSSVSSQEMKFFNQKPR